MTRFIYFLLLFSFVAHAENVHVGDFGATADDQQDDSVAIQSALDSLAKGDTLIFAEGTYDVCSTLVLQHSEQITLRSFTQSKLKKCANFSGEYLLYVKPAQDFTLSSLHFQGLHNGHQVSTWGKQGVYIASATNVKIIGNEFNNFGDAALRVTSGPEADYFTTNTREVMIASNRFSQCRQVTTTQAQTNSYVGGVNDIVVLDNEFESCTLKLSTRAPAQTANVLFNTFRDINKTAFEVSYYSDLWVAHNRFMNIDGFVMNLYPNSQAPRQIPWDNIMFEKNFIHNTRFGLRLNSLGREQLRPVHALTVRDNRFEQVHFAEETNWRDIVRTYSYSDHASFDGVHISGNEYELAPDSDFLYIDPLSRNVYIDNNTALPTQPGS
ncbi:glycoside hydrolase family 55 protein [Pseudoalteromonas sp. MM17-2]|uniref:glycosyl hydrolase family 28-related protein n=1 Tax=Pseudoalteromonas sp. MM17-2 TaxID=2917753 RepID=UPI001EF4F252|nr:glycosyl hydrolase family 28-related protein [Pseudoalteromonas sp. MM17-2]MCG7544986.1 glycoside hydrolase family 55 protein [Pseudoalteromonas sp. MM17-2]